MNEKKELINIFDYDLFDWTDMKTHSISTSKSTQEEDKQIHQRPDKLFSCRQRGDYRYGKERYL